jgi:hypothetical protein
VANAGTLTVTLQAVSQKFTAGMSKASKSLSMFRGAIGPVQAALSGLSVGLAAARFVKVAGDLDTLADSAASLGVSIKDLSGLQYAGVVKGIANDQLSGALDRLNRATVMAADGNKRYSASFGKLGISAGAFTKLDAEEKLFAFSDALNKIEDPAQRSAIAIRLLGNNSADMMDLLSGGSAGLKGMKREAEAMGASIDGSADDIGRFVEQLAKLEAAWTGFQRKVVMNVGPSAASALQVAGAAVQGGSKSGEQAGYGSGIRGRLYGAIYDTLNSNAEQMESRSAVSSFSNPRRGGRNISDKWMEELSKGTAKYLQQAGNIYGSAGSRAGGLIGSGFGAMAGARWMKQEEEKKTKRTSMATPTVGENNILRKGTREEWLARNSEDKQQEQIDIMKAVRDGIHDMAKRGLAVAQLN